MSDTRQLSLFETRLGWFALAGRDGRATWCSFGHANRAAAELAARRALGGTIMLRDWHPTARRRLTEFAAGERVTFEDIELDLDGVPAFHRKVLAACRKIRYGETQTYAKLAAGAGRPRAVRAAGTAMASNPLPILIPCHRVVRSDGGLGGYSAPQGVSVKQRLLLMEARHRRARTDGLIAKSPRRSRKAGAGSARKVRTA